MVFFIKRKIMKKILILAIAAISVLSANAQTDKEAAAAAKQAAKEMKAKAAADLKAFKEKQKADLAAFIEKQKNGASAQAIAITTKDDSIAHIYGTALSRGLKEYATQQLGVDSANFETFAQGILDNVSVDTSDPVKKAYNSGATIGADIINKTEAFSKEYFAADPDKSINATIVGNALVAALLGKSDIEPNVAGTQLQNIMEQRKAENTEKLYGANREAGEKFLAENKTKEGVVTLPSGLQYKVITMGDGEKPKKTDKVSVNYEGKLIDGTVFDSSYQRGKPTSFGVTQVIKGWTEALLLMPVGSKWEIYIPYDLAYGDRDTGREIKPYSALTFVVELLGIESKEVAKPATTTTATKANAKTTAKKK